MKFLSIALVAATVTLGSCTTVPNGGSGDDIISQVQTYTKLACGFVPTATTIANIIAAGNPGVGIAASIAEAICTAVNTPKSVGKAFVVKNVKGYRVTPNAVNGVPVYGKRV